MDPNLRFFQGSVTLLLAHCGTVLTPPWEEELDLKHMSSLSISANAGFTFQSACRPPAAVIFPVPDPARQTPPLPPLFVAASYSCRPDTTPGCGTGNQDLEACKRITG